MPRLGALALITLASGCMPYVLPPVTASVAATRDDANGARTGVRTEVGVAPLDLVDGQLQRRWDAQIAGSYEHTQRDTFGLDASLGPVFHLSDDHDAASRLVPQVVGRWTTRGAGAALRLTLERATFTSQSTDGNYVGGLYGEAALGVYAEVGYLDLDPGSSGAWSVTVGATFRLPFAAGVACCMSLN